MTPTGCPKSRKRLYPLVTELAADGVPVAVMCRVLKLSRQPYYRWLANPITSAELIAAYRANALYDAHRDHPEFGYRFLSTRPATRAKSWRCRRRSKSRPLRRLVFQQSSQRGVTLGG